MSSALPLLFIDVDGVLNPFDAPPGPIPDGFVRHYLRPTTWTDQHPHLLRDDVPDLSVWLHPDHGEELSDLPFELIWATTWEHEANTYISPRIGLPDLPVVTFSIAGGIGPEGTYFKTVDIVKAAAGRPFVWLDDQLDEYDRTFVERHHRAPAWLYDVDPAVGLGLDDFEALARWTDTHTVPDPPGLVDGGS
ncbi:hypothetical protein [Streptomyces niveus]|uniref:hypothetical protein n=1 Tax=Streptomyces niveus TaxID=193462 RepID=UPI003418A06C